MIRFLSVSIVLSLLVSCSNENSNTKHPDVSFAVIDACEQDVISYFSGSQIKSLNVEFEFMKFTKKLQGLENMSGVLELWANGLSADTLNTLINTSIQKCQPNTEFSLELDDEKVKVLFESAYPRGQVSNPESILLTIRNNKLNIHSHVTW